MRMARSILGGAVAAGVLSLAALPATASAGPSTPALSPKYTPNIKCMLLRIEINHTLDLADELDVVIIGDEPVDTGAGEAYTERANQLIEQYERECGTWWPR